MSSDEHGRNATYEGKLGQVERVLDRIIRLEGMGEKADDALLLRQHPELLPELGDRLKALRAIQDAQREAARRARPLESIRKPIEDGAEEDLAFLRRALTNYEILERVRYGGQGAVYRAQQLATKRVVAIKVLLDGPLATDRQRARFEREAELTSRLQHPNIVTLYEYGICRKRPFLALEYIEGLPINDFVLLHDLSPCQIVATWAKVCQAVHCAHQTGIIHRDLNPSNILVDERGEPHILDFGLAKDTRADNGSGRFSGTGQVVGTLPYLSPEQAGGLDGRVDVRSDVYALGVVLYELLTGSFPYTVDGDWSAVRDAIVSIEPLPLRQALKQASPDRLPDLDGVNRDLEMVLHKALSKDKDARYQSADALADDLERYVTGEAVAARAKHRLYALRKLLRRYRAEATFVAVTLLMLGVTMAAVSRAWLVARAQRDTARQATQVAYDLFEQVLDADEAIRPLAGGVAVRDEVLLRASSALPRLDELVEADDAFQSLRTRLAEKRGDIARLQGSRSDAADYYRLFVADALRAAADSASGAQLSDVGRAYGKLASVAGDPAPLYELGIAAAQEVLEHDAGDADARYHLSELHAAYGGYLLESMDYEHALEQYGRTLALSPLADNISLDNGPWAELVASTLSGRGQALVRLGAAQDGIAALEESVRIREAIVAYKSADTTARHRLVVAYVHLATLLRDADRIDEAQNLLRRAVALGELLHALDPGAAQWTRDLYAARHRLGVLCLETGDLKEARGAAEAAASLARELVAAHPDEDEARSTLAFALILQGRVHLSEGNLKQGQEAFAEAAAIRERLWQKKPSDDYRAKHVAEACVWLGIAARRAGEGFRAVAHYARAYEIRNTLCQRNPHVTEFALDLIETQINLSAAHISLDTAGGDRMASSLLDDAEILLEQLEQAGRLAGLERKHAIRLAAIVSNRELIAKRGRSRDAPSSAPAGANEPPERLP